MDQAPNRFVQNPTKKLRFCGCCGELGYSCCFLRSSCVLSVSVRSCAPFDCVIFSCLMSCDVGVRVFPAFWSTRARRFGVVERRPMDDPSSEPAAASASVSAPHSSPNVSLLRAAPLSVLLRRGGSIFDNSEGTSESYNLSSQVDHIDSFLSHTWRTPKKKKFLALSFHFGFFWAYAVSLLTGVVVSTLGGLGLLFFVELDSVSTPFRSVTRVPSGPYAQLLCPLVFWLVLTFHGHLLPLLNFREHRVFLDKVCNVSRTTGPSEPAQRLEHCGDVVFLIDAMIGKMNLLARQCAVSSSPKVDVSVFVVLGATPLGVLFMNVARCVDKVCIHQTDTSLKKDGIAHLAMFLFFSGQMVVLLTDDYLERLWTVYEVATFIMLHPKGRLVVLKVNLPPVHDVSAFFFVLNTKAVNTYLPVVGSTAGSVYVPVLLLFVLKLRRWALEQERRAAYLLSSFSVRSVKCSNESDYAPVMANIRAVLEQMYPSELAEADTAATFDNLVRQSVHEAALNFTGFSGVPYTQLLIFSLSLLGEGFDAVGSEIAAGSPLKEAFPRCWFWFAWHFAGFPTSVPVASLLTRRFAHLRGSSANAYMAVVSLCVIIVFLGVQSFFSSLRERAALGDGFSLIFVLVTWVMFIFGGVVLHPKNRSGRNLHATTNSESMEMAGRLGLPICLSSESSSSPASSTSMNVNATSATIGRPCEVDHATSETPTRQVTRMTL